MSTESALKACGWHDIINRTKNTKNIVVSGNFAVQPFHLLECAKF